MTEFTDTSVEVSPDESSQELDTFDRIEIEGDVVRLDNFSVRDSELARHLESVSEQERPGELLKIIEVGLFCVLRASARQEAEFIKHQAERVIATIESRVGTVPEEVRKALLEKIGTGDGQVLQPLSELIERVSKALTVSLAGLSSLVDDKLDPEKDSTHLGQTLKLIGDKLDPDRKDSVQSVIDDAVKSVTGENGALAKAVKETVSDAIKPLKEEVDLLAKEIRGQEAAEEALQQTTHKGGPYELKVMDDLQPWAKATGAQLEHIGGDNKPGDVKVTATLDSVCGTEVSIVIEARDRQAAKGRKAIAGDLEKKMVERDCNAAIYLSKTAAGLAQEVGDFCEGQGEHGPWVATTHEHLHTAVRLLIVLHRIRSTRSEAPDFDGALIEKQIDRIRTALKRTQAINRKVNTARSSVDEISTEAVAMRDEIRDALDGIEEAIQKSE